MQAVLLMSASTRHCRLWQVLQLQIRVKEGSQIVACRRGVIKRVPAGMPTITIWCSKMVVTAEGENC